MNIVRVISRIVLLSVAAAAFVGLTAIYGDSKRPFSPDPRWREGRAHRPSAPEAARFPELFGEVIIVAIYAVGGRVVLRLRLSPASRSEGKLISLELHRRSKEAKAREDPQLSDTDPA